MPLSPSQGVQKNLVSKNLFLMHGKAALNGFFWWKSLVQIWIIYDCVAHQKCSLSCNSCDAFRKLFKKQPSWFRRAPLVFPIYSALFTQKSCRNAFRKLISKHMRKPGKKADWLATSWGLTFKRMLYWAYHMPFSLLKCCHAHMKFFKKVWKWQLNEAFMQPSPS